MQTHPFSQDFAVRDHAFGAFNATPNAVNSFVTARILTKKTDLEALENLARSPAINDFLARRQLKFGDDTTALLQMATGPERGFLGETLCHDGTPMPTVPLTHQGAVARERVTSLLATAGEGGRPSGFRHADAGLHVFLRPGEIQQVFLRCDLRTDRENLVHAARIEHWTSPARDAYIGGLTTLFVTPFNPF